VTCGREVGLQTNFLNYNYFSVVVVVNPCLLDHQSLSLVCYILCSNSTFMIVHQFFFAYSFFLLRNEEKASHNWRQNSGGISTDWSVIIKLNFFWFNEVSGLFKKPSKRKINLEIDPNVRAIKIWLKWRKPFWGWWTIKTKKNKKSFLMTCHYTSNYCHACLEADWAKIQGGVEV